MNYIEYLYPVIFLGVMGFVLLAIGIRSQSKKLFAAMAMASLAVSFILVIIMPFNGLIYNQLKFSRFDEIFSLILIISVIIIVVPTMHDLKEKPDVFYALLLFMTASMLIIAYSYNLIVLFVSFEGLTIITYILAAYNKTRRNLEGAVKYLFIGVIGTSFNIFGISLFYLSTRTFNLLNIVNISYSRALILALVFMIIGFGFKLAIFPMQQWAIDTYDGSMNSVSSFLSTGSKIAAYFLFLKVLYLGFPGYNIYIFYFFAILSILTMTYGNVSALSETNLKRMLAYSSVAQAGYLILVYAIISYPYHTLVSRSVFIDFGLASAAFYSLAYIFMKGASFISMSIFKKDKIMIDDMAGLNKKSPLLAFSFAILLLSLAGVPITGGFLAKYFLFFTLIIGNIWWLAVIAIINSVISVFYYLRVITYEYRRPVKEEFNLTMGVKYTVIISAFITIALFFSFSLFSYILGVARI
ncbi:NADH-quinone oxidoreductase subunit NuoN [Picrophilus oshimae]|uniref:NADH dehydrogenase subunit N n=1 Tax=Picrophilus torridus (strain ATCC 700027 / DSM 9790 / JCM 10055 / NBRC 100828 / KAW 2/3) TaxID=1122961 RepID=A0A8G2FWS0_PICTO|nr:NADH-quinone oxidoreductase subunit NuoN [Picrophilus oshimae]SMD30935.1 NADH dehydrogenase subunit N [Picrophilus oshimae DSM 9789]